MTDAGAESVSATSDTNVYVSALNFGGNPRRFLNLAETGSIRLATSDVIMAQVGKVLRGKKFAWPEAEIEEALQALVRLAELVKPTERLSIITADPPDNRILECAAAAKFDYIVTGDHRHLLPLQQYGHARIVTAANFLEIVREPSTR